MPRRLSAPLLDRFDIAIRVDRPQVDDLLGRHPAETDATVAARVAERSPPGRRAAAFASTRSFRDQSLDVAGPDDLGRGRHHREVRSGPDRSVPAGCTGSADWPGRWPISTAAGELVERGTTSARPCCCGADASPCSEVEAPVMYPIADADLQAHAAALAGLPGMTPVRLAKLLDGFSPGAGVAGGRAGTHPADPQRKFIARPGATDVAEVGGAATTGREWRVLLPGMAGYPSMLVGDPGAPAVLFALGDPDRSRGPAPGGHRRHPLGHPLRAPGGIRAGRRPGRRGCRRGFRVWPGASTERLTPAPCGPGVSRCGSARGGGRHRTGHRVSAVERDALGAGRQSGSGVLRIGARNQTPSGRVPGPQSDHCRALRRGGRRREPPRWGSLYTAEAAARRSIPVCAVPGSVRSRASEGTNALLVDGCTPVRDATDVLVAISLARTGKGEFRANDANREGSFRGVAGGGGPLVHAGPGVKSHRAVRASNRTPPRMSELEQAVFDAVDDTPTTFETILIRTDLSIATAAEACDNLVEREVLSAGAGWWSRSRS